VAYNLFDPSPGGLEMTNVQTDQLCEAVDTLKQAACAAIDAQCPDRFHQFEKQLNKFGAALRETQQDWWSTEIQTAINHLENGEPLTDADMSVIRTFLVADAEHYLAVENNFNDWLQELGRLMDDMANRAQMPGREPLGELRGVVKDACRLVPDIRNYLEERRRVERFDMALHNADAPSRSMLARVLKEQLRSTTR
jgi:hypothetical protein